MSTIAAISTPNASGGIGVIRISGEDAIVIADKVFKGISGKKLCEYKGYTASFGYIYDGEIKLDECIALVFKAPGSYTGENVVELSCHGGLFVTQSVLRTVLNAGAVTAQPGEFTKRAFLNGKIDLAEAESVMNIISAHGKQALTAALTTLDGKLSGKIKTITDKLVTVSAGMSVWTDYPEDDIPGINEDELKITLKDTAKELNKLLSDFDSGQAVIQGVRTVIAGHPNVGKSTLMNLLTGYDRSIVTSIAGTTRDVIEETVRLGDVVLHLADTAGLRESDDEVEAIGVKMAKEKIERAGLVLAVFDASIPLNDEDRKLIENCKYRKCIAVINKTDLDIKTDIEFIKSNIPSVVYISALAGKGADELKTAVEKILGTDEIDSSSAMLSTERQYQCCKTALEAINESINALEFGMTLDAVNVSLNGAIDSLLELTGEKAKDIVVDEVFSKFCVGK